jgi:hypothetical protein
MTDVEIVEGPATEPAPSRKRKEPSPEVQIIESPAPQAAPEPAPKRRKVAKRAPRQKVKSKEVVAEDEEDPPADKVIWVKVSSGVSYMFYVIDFYIAEEAA